ncbi:MAG: DUF3105 domain-containing protein [Actinobacteria bacterium]|nr:DUF3105 domain-containing protein [Actinomycetota bacterium]
MPNPPVRTASALTALVLALTGCGDSDASDSTTTAALRNATTSSAAQAACSDALKEPLDPASYVHSLGNGDITYTSDPPTSGPHQPGPPISGVLQDPLTRPLQVGAVEAGGILLQYHDLNDAELASLSELAGDLIAVVPNPDLPARVVATAWLNKQTCDGVDPIALQTFIDTHVGRGPEH